MQVVILAGGLGTRLRPLTENLPKPMIPIQGRPFLEYELALLRTHRLTDVIICTGYRGEDIRGHFGDGSRFGLRIRYGDDGSTPLGTAGPLRPAAALLADWFFLTYGDAYLRLDYAAMARAFLGSGHPAMMAAWPNSGHEKSNVHVQDGLVTVYDKAWQGEPLPYLNFGVSILKREVVEMIPEGRPYSQEELYERLIAVRSLAAFEVADRPYEVGSFQGKADFEALIDAGGVEALTVRDSP